MPKAGRKPAGFYAVARGEKPGIYETWDECEVQVNGFQGAKYKKFSTVLEAEEWIKAHNPSAVIDTSAVHASASSAAAALPRHQSMQAGRSAKGKDRESDADIAKEGWQIVYSDGACRGNGKQGSIAGVGVYWGPNDTRNISERCPGAQTNNRAELIAIARILEHAPQDGIPIEIRSDSKYSINALNDWLPAWRKRNYMTANGTPVQNLGIIKYIDALLTERRTLKQNLALKVVFKHVYGHQGEVGNENADHLAVHGCSLPEVSEPDWDALLLEVQERTALAGEAEAATPALAGQPPASQTVSTVGTPAAATPSPKAVIPQSPTKNPVLPPVSLQPSRATFRPAQNTAQAAPAPESNVPVVIPPPAVLPTYVEMGVQTLPWVHPDGLVPPNPCLAPTGSDKQITANVTPEPAPAVTAPQIVDAPLPQNAAIPVITEDELNAYADCLLDDQDLAAELEDD